MWQGQTSKSSMVGFSPAATTAHALAAFSICQQCWWCCSRMAASFRSCCCCCEMQRHCWCYCCCRCLLLLCRQRAQAAACAGGLKQDWETVLLLLAMAAADPGRHNPLRAAWVTRTRKPCRKWKHKLTGDILDPDPCRAPSCQAASVKHQGAQVTEPTTFACAKTPASLQ